MIIKRNINRVHRTWSCASNLKPLPLSQQQQQPQDTEPENEVIGEENQARDDDSVKSIDSDLDGDFANWELDDTHLGDTHASLGDCSMLPIECRDVTDGPYEEDDVLATAIKEAENMFADQKECYHPNTDDVEMIDPPNVAPMDAPKMTPIEKLTYETQGKTHTHFFIDQTVPLTEGEGCIPVETKQIRPQIIKIRKQ